MTQQERIAEIISQLKQIRRERDLSLHDVHDLVLESGGYLSLSSVKRVFADGSENQGFRYHDTIHPLVRALLSVTEETPENNDVTANEIDTLKNVILLKDSIIQELKKENEALSEKNNKAEIYHDETRVDYQQKISHVLDQLKQQREEIDYLRLENDRKSKIIDKLLEK